MVKERADNDQEVGTLSTHCRKWWLKFQQKGLFCYIKCVIIHTIPAHVDEKWTDEMFVRKLSTSDINPLQTCLSNSHQPLESPLRQSPLSGIATPTITHLQNGISNNHPSPDSGHQQSPLPEGLSDNLPSPQSPLRQRLWQSPLSRIHSPTTIPLKCYCNVILNMLSFDVV